MKFVFGQAALAATVVEMIESDANKAVIAGIKAEKKEVERKISNIVEMVADGKGTSSLIDILRDLENQKENYELQLSRAKFEQGYLTKDMIKFYFSQFKDGHEGTIGYRRHLIDVLVNSIHIFDKNENQNDSASSDNGLYGLGRKVVIAFNTSANIENPVTLECSDLTSLVERTRLEVIRTL